MNVTIEQIKNTTNLDYTRKNRAIYKSFYQKKSCILRHLFHETHINKGDYKKLKWYKKWYFLAKKDVGAPTLSKFSYFNGSTLGINQSSAQPYTSEDFEKDLAVFYKQQKYSRPRCKEGFNLLELLLDMQHCADQDTVKTFKSLPEIDKGHFLEQLEKVACTIKL